MKSRIKSCHFWGLNDSFAAYTAAETPNAFQWSGQPLKLLLPVVDLRTLIHGSFGPCELVTQTSPRSVPPFSFAGHVCVTNTHTHTYIHTHTHRRAKSVAIGRILYTACLQSGIKTWQWKMTKRNNFDSVVSSKQEQFTTIIRANNISAVGSSDCGWRKTRQLPTVCHATHGSRRQAWRQRWRSQHHIEPTLPLSSELPVFRHRMSEQIASYRHWWTHD